MHPLSVSVILVLVACSSPPANVRYVDADATGHGDGSSWADAHPSLKEALQAAREGEMLWVAEGRYTPSDSARDVAFELKADVAIYGGFNGTERRLADRDFEQHRAILSGHIGDADDREDNSYHVVWADSVEASAVLDGFTIEGGYASGPYPHNLGGGVFVISASPTLRNLVIRNNHAAKSPEGRDGFGGGMLAAQDSAPLLQRVWFERNTSAGGGGGMANKVRASPRLEEVVFVENEAVMLGGGMTNDRQSAPVLYRVDFIRNRAEYSGAIDNYIDADARLYNVRFLGNRASEYGGAMTNDTDSDVLVVNGLFVGNVAENATKAGAGAVQNNSSTTRLVGVTLAHNTAADGADAIGHREGGHVDVVGSIVTGHAEPLADEGAEQLRVKGTSVEADLQWTTLPSPGTDGAWGTADDDYGDFRHWEGVVPHITPERFPADLDDLDADGDTTEVVAFDLGGISRFTDGSSTAGAFHRSSNTP
ncbi:MAG: hypothetical protein RhofKO_06030 [Rhodothermales bacterium]